ncbi:MAG: hypothetical protein V1800_03090, partial [Candidatus Latescibacterota bacterium]
MQYKRVCLIGMLLCCFATVGTVLGQDYAASVGTEENHLQWGWQSYVMDNGLITVAVVPEIGARVMQYDLDGHPSIYVNP